MAAARKNKTYANRREWHDTIGSMSAADLASLLKAANVGESSDAVDRYAQPAKHPIYRHWLAEQLEKARTAPGPDSQHLHYTAVPGWGKTTFATHFVNGDIDKAKVSGRPAPPPPGGYASTVAAFHSFHTPSVSSSAEADALAATEAAALDFVLSLFKSLFLKFGLPVGNEPAVWGNPPPEAIWLVEDRMYGWRRGENDASKKHFTNPPKAISILESILKSLAGVKTAPTNAPYWIILDGLDKSYLRNMIGLSPPAPTVPFLVQTVLAGKLPSWLKLLCFSRQDVVLDTIHPVAGAPLDLPAVYETQASRDVGALITAHMYDKNALATVHPAFNFEHLYSEVYNAAQQSMWFVNDLFDRPGRVDEASNLYKWKSPTVWHEQYTNNLTKTHKAFAAYISGTRWAAAPTLYEGIAPLWAVLASTRGPIEVATLELLFTLEDGVAKAKPGADPGSNKWKANYVMDSLQDVGPAVRWLPGSPARVELIHKSLWNAREHPQGYYPDSTTSGATSHDYTTSDKPHVMIANMTWHEFETDPTKASAYSYTHGLWHMLVAGHAMHGLRLLFNLPWVSSKINATSYEALVEDYKWWVATAVANSSEMSSQEVGFRDDAETAVKQVIAVLFANRHVLREHPEQLPLVFAVHFRGHESEWLRTLSYQGEALLDPTQARFLDPTQVATFQTAHTGDISAMVITDNRVIVLGSSDGALSFWDFSTGDCLATIAGAHAGSVNALCVLERQQVIASGGADGRICLWAYRPVRGSIGTHVAELAAPGAKSVTALGTWASNTRALTPEDDKSDAGKAKEPTARNLDGVKGLGLASGDVDGQLIIWGLSEVESPLPPVAWPAPKPDFRDRMGAPQFVNLGPALSPGAEAASAAASTPSVSKSLFSTNHSSKTSPPSHPRSPGLYDPADKTKQGNPLFHIDADHYPSSVSMKPERRTKPQRIIQQAANGAIRGISIIEGTGFVALGGDDHIMRIWNPLSGEIVEEKSSRFQAPILDVATLSDGRVLTAHAAPDNAAVVWGSSGTGPSTGPGGAASSSFSGHSAGVTAVETVVNGAQKYVITGSTDGTVRIWNMADSNTERVVRGHAGPVTALAVTTDESLIVSADARGRVVVTHYSPPGAGSGKTKARTFGLSSSRSEGTPIIEPLAEAPGHASQVTALTSLPDGRVVIAHRDRTLRAWNGDKMVGAVNVTGHQFPIGVMLPLGPGHVVTAESADAEGSDRGSIRLIRLGATLSEAAMLENNEAQVERVEWVLSGCPGSVSCMSVIAEGAAAGEPTLVAAGTLSGQVAFWKLPWIGGLSGQGGSIVLPSLVINAGEPVHAVSPGVPVAARTLPPPPSSPAAGSAKPAPPAPPAFSGVLVGTGSGAVQVWRVSQAVIAGDSSGEDAGKGAGAGLKPDHVCSPPANDNGAVHSLAALANGRAAVGYANGSVVVWDVGQKTVAADFSKEHKAKVSALSPCKSNGLVSLDANGGLRVWNLGARPGKHCIGRSELPWNPLGRMSYAPLNTQLAFGDGQHYVAFNLAEIQ